MALITCKADIESFHATHFFGDALDLFGSQFLRPDVAHDEDTGPYGYEEYEEDDGLGYYSDGVKRTLTDEQIAIFRHSELEALRRAEANSSKPDTADDIEPTVNSVGEEIVGTPDMPMDNENPIASTDAPGSAPDVAEDGSEDGEIETEKPVLTKAEMRRQKKLRARQKRKESQKFQPEKKPDLRKRTWDIVETGMDSLHYDDLEMAQGNGSASNTQRKQISYDD